jgi:hypothetical protein
MIKKIFLLLVILTLLLNNSSFAQNISVGFTGNAKFFVVVSILSTILIGVFIFLIFLERKISKLERFLESK